MKKNRLQKNSLVLYKERPARIIDIHSKKIEIEVLELGSLLVRPKDVVFLHPGPLLELRELVSLVGEVKTAWELLQNETVTLAEVADLAYDEYTPSAAWAVWQLINDGLYFKGTPDEVQVQTAEEVEQELANRAAREAEEQAWSAFVNRLDEDRYNQEDTIYLGEVAQLAWGERSNSRVLRQLGLEENQENAHALLLRIGYWDTSVNPYPRRARLPLSLPAVVLPDFREEHRHDLTYLQSFAIDDQGNQDPDDAISLEGGKLWVHIADAAALVPVGSPADLEARSRIASLYLPEGTVPMLPPRAVAELGLGLAPISPALSVAIELRDDGSIANWEVKKSWVKVTRLTYAEAERGLESEPFSSMVNLTEKHASLRLKNGAINLELPEVKIIVDGDRVVIRPIIPLRSRALVQESMLIAGAAVAQFAIDNRIPVPFTVQDSPESEPVPTESLSGMFAIRRTLRPSHQSTTPGKHAGLGLGSYVQSTSPLRRYLDLVVHQQLRGFLDGQALLGEKEIVERIGMVSAVIGSIRRCERLSNEHWTINYLLNKDAWQGQGVVVEKHGNRSRIVIPELGLETDLFSRQRLELDEQVEISFTGANLPHLASHFTLKGLA